MTMFDAVAAQVCKRLDGKDKFYHPRKKWDASDPKGCWTRDWSESEYGKSLDLGFWMFDTQTEAFAKADTLEWSLVSWDDYAQKWTVERFDGPRG